MEIILLLIITLLALFLWVKERNKRLIKEKALAESLFLNQIIGRNDCKYFFVLDSTLSVKSTNYCKIGSKEQPNNNLLGEVIACKNAKESGACGNHIKCLECVIRQELVKCIKEETAVSYSESPIVLREEVNGATSYNLTFSACKTRIDNSERIILTIHKIEELEELKKTLKNNEKRVSYFFDSIQVGCAICDSKGEIIDLNDAYVELLGAKSKEAICNRLNIFNDPCINPEFKEMIKAGVPVLGELKYNYKKINKWYVTSKHTGIHYYRFVTSYTFDKLGKINQIYLICLENTDIHLLLRQNKMFYDLISHASEVSNTGFCSFNLLKKEQLVTPQYLKNLGFNEGEEVVFTNTASLTTVHPEDLAWINNYLASAKNGIVDPVERKIRVFKEGKYGWIKQYFIQQKYEASNGIIILCGMNIDINAQIEIEEQLTEAKDRAESSDRLKSAFLANVSHEIRTPLNAIVGFSELMLETEDREEMGVYELIIRENSDLLLKLVKDILDLSKIETGTLEYSWTDINLNEILEELYYTFQAKEAANKQIKIKLETDLESCIIHTEPKRITQVLTHFIDNALKFTQEGSVTIGYKLDNDICIYVKDTGCGIPKEMHAEVFQRFVKLNHFEQGTGLGLSICSSIIQTMGGTIGVDSEPGKGSTFWCRLPINTKQMPIYPTESYA